VLTLVRLQALMNVKVVFKILLSTKGLLANVALPRLLVGISVHVELVLSQVAFGTNQTTQLTADFFMFPHMRYDRVRVFQDLGTTRFCARYLVRAVDYVDVILEVVSGH